MKRKNKLYVVIAIVLVVALSAIIYRVFFYKQAEIKVLETVTASRGDIQGTLIVTGIIKPQVGAVVKIGTRATGAITKMHVKVGDKVAKGQIVALIDDREILQDIRQLQAVIESIEHTIKQVELTYPEKIKEAKANLDYARANYQREKQLLTNEYTTRDAVDKAYTQYIVAESIYKRLQDEYDSQLKILRANLVDKQAQLKQQEIRLSYTKIISPINGVVSDITAQEGEMVVAGLQVANLITVLDPSKLEAWIYIDETDISKVKVGQNVQYYVDTLPTKHFKGKINKIYPQPVVKDNIVYYLAIVSVDEQTAEFLKPEMTTHAKIVYSEKRDVITLANSAVKFEKGRQVAYKVHPNGKTEKIQIKTGLRGEEKTEIIEGVSEGEVFASKLILPPSALKSQDAPTQRPQGMQQGGRQR